MLLKNYKYQHRHIYKTVYIFIYSNLETKPKYKLTYFPIKFRAEPIRLLFAQGGLDFEDNRIGEEWTKLKPGDY